MFIVNVEGAIIYNEKWLIIQRSQKEEHAGGLLSLVGGKCDLEGESYDILERTLHREINEEIGIDVDILNYVTNSSFTTDTGLNVVDVVFLCRHKSGEPYVKSPDEVESIKQMTTSEILSHRKAPYYLRRNLQLADQSLNSNNK
ncbi:NUDIX domain-containing protein [Piscibacillus sp. B03]|uniref:NUDIX domain-containing protein n=1 Tax=Piscibacillus sp. B03 TaxID=3457430 RepID=UPI003FCCCEFE